MLAHPPTANQGVPTLLNGPHGSDEPSRGNGSTVLAGALVTSPRRVRRTGTRMRRVGSRIASLAISHSQDVHTQAQVLDRLGLAGDEFAEGIFARCGVKRRHLNLDADFLARSLQGRASQVERELLERSIAAVDALAVDPQEIGTVISASLYSLGVPTLAHRLIEHYQMDPATDKYHITGVGCASGVPLMRLATQVLHEHPDKHTLVVAAESMSSILTSATPTDAKAKTVGSAIFGDGCAAALLTRHPRADGPVILASQVHQIGSTLGAVSLEVSSEDGYLHLARELPDLAGAGLPGVVGSFLRHHDLRHSDIDHWIVHPGGRRIIENTQSALELTDDQVATSWSALAEHGNVGTPSILYVLKDTIERSQPEPGERGLMVTIGPGVTVGMMLLAW
ncbi:MAG TPA: 3-oxoacyl-[acyl-carrier-protein] synthase III C-terminal domain-containing protein [Solirubrobacteraceae bacterium]|nr:3-oxoacyl-[acyl-carrier-protein] synthase III C-terminal domain-containing protein [Solirubrobacteraceae bacterium]